jgi:hypothetical protein
MQMQGMAELMIWHIRILQMQHTINKLHKLHRFKCTKTVIITGAILLKETKSYIWVALSTAVSVCKKSNKDTMPHKYPPAKYNLRKVETIVKLARSRKLKVVFNNQQRSLRMFMGTKI